MGTTTVSFALNVDDVDAVMAQAFAAGGTLCGTGDVVEEAYWGDRIGQTIGPADHI